MKPRELLGTAVVPGGEVLRLFRRNDDFMIVLERCELMSSRMSGSEDALAVMTCERLGDRPTPHVLIGGALILPMATRRLINRSVRLA